MRHASPTSLTQCPSSIRIGVLEGYRLQETRTRKREKINLIIIPALLTALRNACNHAPIRMMLRFRQKLKPAAAGASTGFKTNLVVEKMIPGIRALGQGEKNRPLVAHVREKGCHLISAATYGPGTRERSAPSGEGPQVLQEAHMTTLRINTLRGCWCPGEATKPLFLFVFFCLFLRIHPWEIWA